jgi:hypothetical protein
MLMGTQETERTKWIAVDDGLDGARERLAATMNRTGASRRSISMSGDVERSAVSRFLSGQRVPNVAYQNERDQPHEPTSGARGYGTKRDRRENSLPEKLSCCAKLSANGVSVRAWAR